MTPDKNFKLKTSTKRIIALMHGNNADRNQFKNMMIDAQLAEEAARRAALKSKEVNTGRHSKEGVALD
jgi:hypothetical protein